LSRSGYIKEWEGQLDEVKRRVSGDLFPTFLEKEDLYPLAKLGKPMVLRNDSAEYAIIPWK
jgi:hypothetical protein